MSEKNAMQPEDERGSEVLKAAIADLHTIDPDSEYYAVTLSADESGTINWDIQGHWVGSTAESGQPRREIRRASLVSTEHMAQLWEGLGQSFVIVRNEIQLWLYMEYICGNALVEQSIGERYLDFLQEGRECMVVGGMGGYLDVATAPAGQVQHAPTQKMRMRVLKRDDFRCRLCGERPADNVHIVLHVHHIKEHGQGGATVEDNLITLCHSCHGGLEPHYEPRLYELLGVERIPDREESAAQHSARVQLLRQQRQRQRERAGAKQEGKKNKGEGKGTDTDEEQKSENG